MLPRPCRKACCVQVTFGKGYDKDIVSTPRERLMRPGPVHTGFHHADIHLIYKSAGGCDLHADVYQPVTDNGPRFFGAAPQPGRTDRSFGRRIPCTDGRCRAGTENHRRGVPYGYGDIIGDWYSTPNTFYRQEPIVSRENAYSLIRDVPLSASDITRRPFYLYCRQHGVWPDEVMVFLDKHLSKCNFTARVMA